MEIHYPYNGLLIDYENVVKYNVNLDPLAPHLAFRFGIGDKGVGYLLLL